MTDPKTYVPFSSPNARLDFTFLYPSDWRLRETHGEGYEEAFILGPPNELGTYSAALVVRVSALRSTSEPSPPVDMLAQAYLSRNQRAAGFHLLSQTNGVLAGVDAIEIEVGYTIPLPVRTAHPAQTPILERRIMLKKAGYLYELIYRTAASDYDRHLEAFRHLARTFEFTDAGADLRRRPLVASGA